MLMKPVELLSVLHMAQRLKDTTRHAYTTGGGPPNRSGPSRGGSQVGDFFKYYIT